MIPFKHLLALLYGRWYQEAGKSLGECDPLVLDPQGRRFATPSLQDFLADWGYAELATPEVLETLLSLHRQDLLELLHLPDVDLPDLQAQLGLRLLQGGMVEEVDCWDDWRTFSPTLFFRWEGQWRPSQRFKYNAPPMAALYLAALREVEEISWTLDLSRGSVYTHSPQALWACILRGQRPWREGSGESVPPPVLPVFLEKTRYHGCVAVFSWKGQEMRLVPASMKLLDAVIFLVESGERILTDGAYIAPVFSLSRLRRWLREGDPWDWLEAEF